MSAPASEALLREWLRIRLLRREVEASLARVEAEDRAAEAAYFDQCDIELHGRKLERVTFAQALAETAR